MRRRMENKIFTPSDRGFTYEVIGRLFLCAVVAIVYQSGWWYPLLAAPVFWQIWLIITGRVSRIDNPFYRLAADILSYCIWALYVAYSTYSFGLYIGRWYGFILGFVIGIVVCNVLGLLFPSRWTFEIIDDRMKGTSFLE